MTRTSTRPTLSKCIPLPNKHLEVGVSNKCLVFFSSPFPFSPQHQSRTNLNGSLSRDGGRGPWGGWRGFCFIRLRVLLQTASFVYYLEDLKNCLVKYVRFSGQKIRRFPFVSPRTGPLKTVITGGDKGTASHSKVTEGLGEGRLASCP